MSILTKPVGEKDRKLLVHPKPAVDRSAIRKAGAEFIIDPSGCHLDHNKQYFVEEKAAGHRNLLARDASGKKHCYGRRLNVKKEYADIWEKVKKMPQPDLPKETVVDFEMVWPGHPDSEVVTAMKECPEELRMRCFAVPILCGKLQILNNSLSYIEGREELVGLVGKENCTKRFTSLYPHNEARFMVDDVAFYLEYAKAQNLEGFVLKEKSCAGWWKLKGILEADVFITGFKISTAETRRGMVTAVEVSVMDGDKERYIGNVSGFNLEEMDNMTRAYNLYKVTPKNHYFKQVIRIQYQEMAGKGGLKHAFRDVFRTDKNWESCSMEQFK